MQRAVLILVTLGLTVFALRPAAAQLPDVVSYQGYLELAGEPVNDPAARLIFKIYTNAEGGTALWSEQHLDVPVVDGVFSVLLGSVNAVGFQGLPFGEPLWLGLNPGGGELIPRSPLVGVPLSMYSRRAGSTTGINIVEPTTGADAPGVIAGHESNTIGPGVDGATISGGGYDGGATDIWPNRVEADYGTIGGGRNNSVTEFAGTVGGGTANVASGDRATVAGGRENTASDLYSTVGGGSLNVAGDYYATVGGGLENTADAGAVIAGGLLNTASGANSTVGGGHSNVTSGENSTVGGGMENSATAWESTVGGGWQNTASADRATVAGGNDNTASRYASTVGGGLGNIADGFASTVPGGRDNVASGDYSMATGFSAKARHYGSFVWNDASGLGFDSVYTTANYQYLIRAAGGVGIGTNAPSADVHIAGDSHGNKPHLFLQETGANDYARLRLQNSDAAADYWDIAAGSANTERLNFFTRGHNVVTFLPHHIDYVNLISTSVGAVLTQGGIWQNNSSRASKTDFEALDGDEVLKKLAELPVTRWRYKVEPESVRHVGPVAEDFYDAFGLGTDDTTIGTVDADGIALAAIQRLHELVQEQMAEIKALRCRVATLEGRPTD